ncbi:MAG: hypothetical protein AB7N65_16835 [Vicinamibacterales bacterium]
MTPPVRLGVLVAAVLLSQTALPATDRSAAAARARPVARTILALYDSRWTPDPRESAIHAMAEMPLNHLGLVVRYHDIRSGFPAPETLGDVRGVLTWFATDGLPSPRVYLRWLGAVIDAGMSVAIIGAVGGLKDEGGALIPTDDANRVLMRIGWRIDGTWHTTTTGARFEVSDPAMIGFERPLPVVAPPYATVRVTARDTRAVLRVGVPGRPALQSDLVIVGPRGGYVAPGYAYFSDGAPEREFRQWYLNPFEFFRVAFGTDEVPKLDTTTLNGRRIYYSHIDGDGWRNLTQIEPERTRFGSAARVVLERIVRRHPDLPVTVGAIIADLDPTWSGTAESLSAAKAFYALDHVEPAIHTYSHPLEWRAFESEVGAGGLEPRRTILHGPDVTHADSTALARSYDKQPFAIEREIDHAAAFVNRLLPPGRRVALVQWSGDTRPFRAAVERARRAGLANINGGDTRFDPDFPSIAWVSPLGSRVDGELQVYASNSNENTYTNLWRERFFGFGLLRRTVLNTGAPRRLKPFNLYYHMYSGERLASLNAVLANLALARALPLAPIEASRYSRLVEGFFSAVVESEGQSAWRIRQRGAVQTIRFDDQAAASVDWVRSRGVIGQRRELGSLYVFLEEADAAPLVALTSNARGEPDRPYLVESRWRVHHVRHEGEVLRYGTDGFGPGEARWHWPLSGDVELRWRVEGASISGGLRLSPDDAGMLSVRLPQVTGRRVRVSIRPVRGPDGH